MQPIQHTPRRTLAAMALGLVVASAAALTGTPAAQAADPRHSTSMIFDGGGDDELNGLRYHSFRIPSIATTTDGSLLAFAEGRATGNGDFGNINLVYKRSTDNGKTWSKLQEVVGSGEGVWGNPTPVVDQDTGRIWMFMNHQPADAGKVDEWGERRTFTAYSDDDGQTWSKPVDRTEELTPKKKPGGGDVTWDAVGPGNGIQTTVDHPGRLVIPAQHRMIYSDDHGESWKTEFLTTEDGKPMEQTGESTVAELTDGTLYRNDRAETSVWEKQKRRQVTTGRIGEGYAPFTAASCLLDPKSQGSVVRYNTDDPARLVFLNSASTETRTKMRVRVSEDEGKTWRISRPLSDEPLDLPAGAKEGGYSSMTKTTDYSVGALVEVNEDTSNNAGSHRSIAFRKFNLPWLMAGEQDSDCSGR
ncbi:sialidase-1 [Naumannella cuiyingiana]|uniref:exo-alpha-sialidase n=1 Tax=Naumannella cuiyingiana TaxID=1347891 RepID=A0A7Z0IKP6_9ACTN|nr:sialidase family protein [Naumannella cuiyingiana]NYI70805.1 sialidase-1 [Naumannella cuiyingiana]